MILLIAFFSGLGVLAFLRWIGGPLPYPYGRAEVPTEAPADRVLASMREEARALDVVGPGPSGPIARAPAATIGCAFVRAGVEVLPSAELVRALRAADPRLTVTEAFRTLRELEEGEALLLLGAPAEAVRPGDLALSPPGASGFVLGSARTLIPLEELRELGRGDRMERAS